MWVTEKFTVTPNSDFIHKMWQVAMIQSQISADPITQHATGSSARSPCTTFAWVWGLFSVKHCVLTSNTNRQQSEFGSVVRHCRGFPFHMKCHWNHRELSQSFTALPEAGTRPQQSERRSHNIDIHTQRKMNWYSFICFKKRITQTPSDRRHTHVWQHTHTQCAHRTEG